MVQANNDVDIVGIYIYSGNTVEHKQQSLEVPNFQTPSEVNHETYPCPNSHYTCWLTGLTGSPI